MPWVLLTAAVRAIDRFAELCGVAIAWLMVPLVGAVIYEVVARCASARTSAPISSGSAGRSAPGA